MTIQEYIEGKVKELIISLDKTIDIDGVIDETEAKNQLRTALLEIYKQTKEKNL